MQMKQVTIRAQNGIVGATGHRVIDLVTIGERGNVFGDTDILIIQLYV